jgi:D-xylose transport system substrate-binding protein
MLAMAAMSACSGSSKPRPSSSGANAGGGLPPSSLTPASFTNDFSLMARLHSVAAAGKGRIVVLLSETQSPPRDAQYDGSYLAKAFGTAGLAASDFQIDNAEGSAQTMQNEAAAAVSGGAQVLIVDALDPASGAAIEANAQQHGLKVIDYDRFTLNGHATYYVGFDGLTVGKLIGQGLEECVSAWNVAKPQVLEIDGDPADNTTVLAAQGYNSVLDPLFAAGTYKKVAEPPGAGGNDQALRLFEKQYAAHPRINAIVTGGDGLANAIIGGLKSHKIPAEQIPVTGQGATLQGMQNILSGYQCTTVYEPVYVEAQVAATLAVYLRAGQTPPTGLIAGQTSGQAGSVPSVLLTPILVNAQNMESTVIKDGFITPSDLCVGPLVAPCGQRGIH